MSAAEDFADVVRTALGHPDPVDVTAADTAPRMPAPNKAQGTSDGAMPPMPTALLFADALHAQMRRSWINQPTATGDPAAAGQHAGWSDVQ